MPYRNIYIANRAALRLKARQLTVDNGDQAFTFPIEDIRSVVIDQPLATFSAQLLNALAEEGVCVILTNEKHLPSCTLIPIAAYHRQHKRITLQVEQTRPKLKRIWQKIVIAKIRNQAECLKLNGIPAYESLEDIAKAVQSGDSTNREGYAANVYFKALFGKDFTRGDESEINAALNYGYAILRSFIAKTIAAEGLEPSLGIHHKNELNPFNLADDLIEPFRPVVDYYVFNHYKTWGGGFGTAQKAELVLLLNCKSVVEGKTCSLSHAIERLVQSVVSSFEKEEIALQLPTLVKTDYFDYD